MIVLDLNLVIYAYDTASPQHKSAIRWLEKALSGGEPVGLPWQTASAFLRISTNANLPGDRFTSEEAAQILDELLDQPNVRLLVPGEHHWGLFRQMITEGQARGPLVSDAELAALTIEHGGVLHTTDRDFARFPGLRWTNPLA
jgi:toxin-antitoxin system PIN domain toxin